MPFSPQVNFNGFGFVTDKVNWVTLTDTFTADSSYLGFIIGNFKNDASTSKILVGGGTGMSCYFYIDSISVEKIADPSIVKPNDGAGVKASIHPNPFTEQAVLLVENLHGGSYTMSIINVQGAVVREIENIQPGQTVINRAGLAAGFYYYVLQDKAGPVLRGKMVVN